MKKLFNYLQNKWHIQSPFALGVIILVFAITGSSSMWVSNFVVDSLGDWLPEQPLLRLLAKFILITPIYMVLLLFFGFLSGQFTFFKNMVLKTGKGILKLVSLR